MRNIAEYPITTDEIVKYLESLRDQSISELKKQVVCGDMTPCLLDKAIEIVKSSRLP